MKTYSGSRGKLSRIRISALSVSDQPLILATLFPMIECSVPFSQKAAWTQGRVCPYVPRPESVSRK
jgi:hypothetical protein